MKQVTQQTISYTAKQCGTLALCGFYIGDVIDVNALDTLVYRTPDV